MARAKKIPLITDFNHIPAEALVPKEEQPYPLPAHWKWVRLGTTVKNITAKTESFDAADKYLGLEDLNTGGGILRISDTNGIKSAKTVFQYGDVLYGKLRPYLNKHAVANFSGVCSTDILALRPERIIDAAYLDFWLSTPFFLNAAITNSKGVNLPRVSFNSIARYPFPLPPIEEQKQIVAYLDEKLGKTNSVREKLQDFLDHAGKRKDNLIQAGVTGHLTSHWREEHLSEASQDTELPEGSLISKEEQPYPIPEHWKWVRLGSVIELLSGRDAKLAECNDSGLGIPYVMGASNIRDSRLEIERWIEKPKVVSYAGDLLLTVKGTVGKLYIQTEPELNLSRQLMGLRPSAVISVSYLERFFATHVEQLSAQAVGLIPGISRAHILDLAIPLPPMGEQEEIARILDKQLERAEKTDKLVAEVLERLDTMKQQIVSAALAGRLSLQVR